MNATEIINLLSDKLPLLKQKYPIAQLALFGSYAGAENNSNSDVDIMVEFNKPVGMELIDLAFDLEKLIGKKVDLVSRKGIKPKYFDFIKNDLMYAKT